MDSTFTAPPAEEPVTDRSVLMRGRMRHTRNFIMLLAPVVVVTAPRWPLDSAPHQMLESAGHILVMAGVLIRIFASVYVGGRKNETLISAGPFSVVRNPLYVGSFFAMMGLGLLTSSLAITGLLVLAFLVCYKITVAKEELFLHGRFGDAYAQYMQRVPRWLPKLSLWQNADELAVRPYFVLRTILDGSLFFLAIPLLETICELREHGILPTFFILP